MTTTPFRLLVASVLLAAAGAAAPAHATVENPQVTREGEGARRAALNKRERTPFSADAWSKLTNWTNGAALTSATTEGKVVLIVTWSDYLPTAKRTVSAATRLAEKFGKDGLIVVMVHDVKEWESATKPKAANEANMLLVAQDEKGEFRKMLDVDQDPDFYLIDRAGQLRFADVTNEALELGVKTLIDEKAEAAAGLNDRIKQANEEARKAALRTAAANAKADMIQIPALPFSKPSEAEYNKAKWPDLPRDKQKEREEPNARIALADITLPESGWYPRKPNLEGKIVFTYNWHPALLFHMGGMADAFDTLQRQYSRDVVFVGLVTMYESVNIVNLTKDDKDPEITKERVKKFLEVRSYDHYIALSLESNLHATATANASNSGDRIIPGIVILSSDGKPRYANFPPDVPNIGWRSALDAILAADPGVKARRKAEDEWLKAQKKEAEGE
ncbi:MAG TPA: hypothetical protein VK157_05780 [Phycisphaerales bacterium]|nr:hypothetical protein [Phycisphaerales bacterium]